MTTAKAQASTQGVPLARSSPTASNPRLRGKSFDNLSALTESADALFEAGFRRSIFLSRPWFQNLIQTSFPDGDRVRIFMVEDPAVPGAPVLLLPASHGRSILLKPRTLSSLTNFYSPLFEPLIAANCDPRWALEKLAETIAADSPSWDVLNLRWLNNNSPLFEHFAGALRSAGFIVQTYFCSGNWFEPVAGRSYEEYLRDLRSSVRNIARSKARKIERSGRVRLEIVSAGDALGDAIGAYERIYNSSWKTPEPFPEFMPGLLRAFAKEGWLRLGLAYVDEEPAAAQVWFVANEVASIYKIAYDRKFKDLSVGSYLTMHMLREAIDVEKVREIDYLTGDDQYKRDWMSQRRERWGILAMNPRTPKGAAAVVRHVGGRFAKRAIQRLVNSLRAGTAPHARTPVSKQGVNSLKED
jgi:hypothetical protein